jgi:hypothetical protein
LKKRPINSFIKHKIQINREVEKTKANCRTRKDLNSLAARESGARKIVIGYLQRIRKIGQEIAQE